MSKAPMMSDNQPLQTDSPAPSLTETIDQLFARALDARDDGEDELAAELFSQLIERAPDNRDFRFKHILALEKHGAWALADDACLNASRYFKDDLLFIQEWSRIPDALCNWDESISRRKSLLETFPVSKHKDSILAVTEQILPMLESANRAGAKNLIEQYWPSILEICLAPRQVMDGLLALCMFDKASTFCRRVMEVYSTNITDGMDFKNALTLAEKAAANMEITNVDFADVRLISLGQNCLSYALPARWGLNKFAGYDEEITPFDLGAFPRIFAMDLIKADFASFYDKSKFVISKAERGMPMLRYEPYWIPYYHERGKFWVDESMEPIHSHILNQVETFRRISKSKKKLYIFCLCGEGDLDALIEEASILLDEHSRLLIIDVLQKSSAPKPALQVTYLHLPYPRDYNWNWIGDYTSDQGLSFEQEIIEHIKSELHNLSDSHP
jgi:hypothetical protein